MSGLASTGGQYDEAEIERQLQEEFRRRHGLPAGSAIAAPQAAAFSALTARARPGDYSHLGMLGAVEAAASPYYARPAAVPHPSHQAAAAAAAAAAVPYTRVGATDPYSTLAAGQAARPAYPAPAAEPSSTPLTDLYASHHTNKQAAIQHAVAANFAAAYGTPAAAPAAGAALDQRYASTYGVPPAPQAAASAAYPAEPPPYSSQAAQDIAIMQQAYHRERERSAMKRAERYSTTSSPPRSPSFKTPKGKTPGAKSPVSVKSSPSPPTSKKKEVAVLSKDKDGKAIVEDRGSTWYMGCVPLGVDDDKYWLSELQVFLRSHFAEAFAATEEDIAAPMHGRNKPIALGQVGIRCMHCKRKLKQSSSRFAKCGAHWSNGASSIHFQATIRPKGDNRQRRTRV